MGKVIELAGQREQRLQGKARAAEKLKIQALKAVADDIDGVIRSHLRRTSLTNAEIAGVMAHRLGALLGCSTRKKQIWDICKDVVREKASIDS